MQIQQYQIVQNFWLSIEFPLTLSTNREKVHRHTWNPMKASILLLVTRHPLPVPVTAFSEETSWNMAAFCRDAVCTVGTFWHPHLNIQQTVAHVMGLLLEVLQSLYAGMCVWVCLMGIKVVTRFNARPYCKPNDSPNSLSSRHTNTHTHTDISSFPAPITAPHLPDSQ